MIYVAPFSHANYFEPGAHPYVFGIDTPDGALDPLVAPVEAFGPWVRWPGRWGNSTGALGGRLGGRSPASPAHQGVRWSAPSTYHRLAQASSPVRALSRVLGLGSAVTQPRLRALAAHRADGAVELGWTAGRGPLRGATHLHVTVHDADGGLLGSSVERIRGRAGTLRVGAPPPRRASASRPTTRCDSVLTPYMRPWRRTPTAPEESRTCHPSRCTHDT